MGDTGIFKEEVRGDQAQRLEGLVPLTSSYGSSFLSSHGAFLSGFRGVGQVTQMFPQGLTAETWEEFQFRRTSAAFPCPLHPPSLGALSLGPPPASCSPSEMPAA